MYYLFIDNVTSIEGIDNDVTKSAVSNDSSSKQFERLISIAVPTLFGLIVAVGLVGNLVVVLVVALHRRARTATSLLMLNLAVADLVFIVVCVPTTAIKFALPFWPFGEVWCKVGIWLCVIWLFTLCLLILSY